MDDLFDRLDKRGDARIKHDARDDHGAEVLDAPVSQGMFPVGRFSRKFRAHDRDDGRKGVGEVVDRIEDDRDGVGEASPTAALNAARSTFVTIPTALVRTMILSRVSVNGSQRCSSVPIIRFYLI